MKLLKPTAILATLLISACTTAAYEGSRKPDSEIAKIVSDRITIATIDGKDVPYSGGNYATFKVLPGNHTVGIALNDTSNYPRTRISTHPLTATFKADAGKTYIARPVYDDAKWSPEIVLKE